MSQSPGEVLLALCEHAKKEVLLVAPFIKTESLKKILASIPAENKYLTVVTRWIPSEIALGVSDLEVFDILSTRANTKLLLHPSLHAKLYRVDNRCLLGSANITAKALGWCSTPNIEILIEVNPEDAAVKELELILLTQAITATESIRIATQIEVDAFKLKTIDELNEENNSASPLSNVWLPTCNKPEYLYKIYSGQDNSNLLDSVVNAGKHDIATLNLLSGMKEEEFKKYIAAVFENTPVLQEIHTLSKSSGITTEAAEIVIEKYCTHLATPLYDAALYWHIFKIWLIFFFPQRYRIRAAAEILEIAKEI